MICLLSNQRRIIFFLTVFTLCINYPRAQAQSHIVPNVLRIKEGTPAGTVLIPDLIGFLYGRNRNPSDSHTPSNDPKSDNLLAIGNAAMPGANWFAIDQARGSLLIKSPPNRDILCPTEQRLPETAVSVDRGAIEFPEYDMSTSSKFNLDITNDDCILKLSIIHGSSSNPSFNILTIVLEDVNDHTPTFDMKNNVDPKTNELILTVSETPSYSVSKKELNAKLGTERPPLKISLPLAKDPDYGINGIKGYRLEGEDAFLFRLEVGSLTDSLTDRNIQSSLTQPNLYSNSKSNKLWLVPIVSSVAGTDSIHTGELDREHRSEYHLVLVAYDGGSPSRMGRLPIKLVVEDVNDHAPEFNQEFYTGRMSENDPPGHVLFEFSARDADSSKDNGMVMFRIPGQQEHNHGQGQFDNLISTQEDLIELSESQMIAAQLFAVEYIMDKSKDMSRTGEGTSNSTIYGQLIIRRQNKDKHLITVSKALSIAKQTQGMNTFKLGSYAGSPPNPSDLNNKGAQLHFFIEAFDKGHPKPLSTRVPVHVYITDVNDHAPQIFISYLKPTRPLVGITSLNMDRRQMWGKVKENLDRAMLAQVTVTDQDAVFTSTDMICKTNDSRFSLEDISTPSDLINDLNPLWTGGSFYGSKSQSKLVDWHMQSKTMIINRAHSMPTKMYKLMSQTPLDREAQDAHASWIKFVIICVDNHNGQLPGGQLTSEAEVFILIEDSNDNAPIFDHTQYKFHVPENYPVLKTEHGLSMSSGERYAIGSVHATDKDEGINAALEYRLVSNPSSSIQIDSQTGMLFVTQPFDRETVNELVFQVLAIDCHTRNISSDGPTCDGGHRLTGTSDVQVIIDDLNDSPPVFQEASYHFEVEEGLDIIKVGQVWATDGDYDEAARISYRLAVGTNQRSKDFTIDNLHENTIPGSLANTQNLYDEALEITTHFQIDPRTGVIHLKGRLDRERRAHYEFVVLAVDNPRAIPSKLFSQQRGVGNEVVQFTATATVLVTVLDHNDNPPRIISPLNHVEFTLGPEQLIAGNTIFTIRATDPDQGENGTIEYRLLHVEDDLGLWTSSGERSKSEESLSNSTNPNTRTSLVLDDKSQADKSDPSERYPFAVDRTAGICYLRENLPSLNSEGPRAFMLRILVYDLGKPYSLNTTLIVRVTRQSYTSSGIATNSLQSHRVSPKDFHHNSKADGSLNTFTDGFSHGLKGDLKLGQARISDRTMVVILSTVFILLLLTTVVLLLLVRYRRLIIRNMAVDRHLPPEGSGSKANVGFTAGKPLSPSQNYNGFNGLFAEVVAAPWVRNSTSPLVYPSNYNYPTIYNTGVGRVSNSPRVCLSNPAVCWSPTASMCKSPPPTSQSIQHETQATHGTPTMNISESPAQTLGPSSLNTPFNDITHNYILQNCNIQDDDLGNETNYRNVKMNNRNGEIMHHPNDGIQVLDNTCDRGALVNQPWFSDLTGRHKVITSDGGQKMHSIRRAAVSLEELNDCRDEAANRDYNRLVRFAGSPNCQSHLSPPLIERLPNRSEYQTLNLFSHTNNSTEDTEQIKWQHFNSNNLRSPILVPVDHPMSKSGVFTFGRQMASSNEPEPPDLFQLQSLLPSVHSRSSDRSILDESRRSDDFQLCTLKSSLKSNTHGGLVGQSPRKVTKQSILRSIPCSLPSSDSPNQQIQQQQLTPTLVSFDRSPTNPSSYEDSKSSQSKSNRPAKSVTLISPKKQALVEKPSLKSNSATLLSKTLNIEGSFV